MSRTFILMRLCWLVSPFAFVVVDADGKARSHTDTVFLSDLPYASFPIITLYTIAYYASPDKSLLKPIPLTWGAPTASLRGPLVVSHKPTAIAHRNAIGAHSGSYSIYRALAMALNTLDPAHVPDYTNTHPPFPITPNASWFDPGKIVSLDPWGHLAQTEFEGYNKRGLDVRPTISLTKAHIKMSELDRAYSRGEILPDGKVVHNSLPRESPLGTSGNKGNKEENREDAGVEVTTSKAAVEPVWHLPGMAARFGISEDLLRRALFEGESPGFLFVEDALSQRRRLHMLILYFTYNPCCELVVRDRRDVPRTDHPARPQSLPPPHRRPDRLHLRQPPTSPRPNQRAHPACPRRMQRIRRVRVGHLYLSSLSDLWDRGGDQVCAEGWGGVGSLFPKRREGFGGGYQV
jgi:hypothetical protein